MKTIDERVKDLALELNSSEVVARAVLNIAKNGEHFKKLFLNPSKLEREHVKSALKLEILNGIESGEFTEETEFYFNGKSFTLETLKSNFW